jgi:polyisoprenoid-binding protein YceI
MSDSEALGPRFFVGASSADATGWSARAVQITTWNIDTLHSTISFVVRHMLVAKVRGRFNRWRGELQFEAASPQAASVTAEIDVSSIDTNVPQRDAHLRSADFLDGGRFPFIGFRSTRLEPTAEGIFKLIGELTIRGVTREVVLDVEYGGRMRDPSGTDRIGFSARTTINRRAFGVTFNQVLDSGGLALGDNLAIEIEIEATSQPHANAVHPSIVSPSSAR